MLLRMNHNMIFEKFKQQIDDLEEKRRIVKQAEEEKLKTLIESVKKEVTVVFTTLGPYIDYCFCACKLTDEEKYITFVEPYGFVMKIKWTIKWFYSKINISGNSRMNFTVNTQDVLAGNLKDLDQLEFLHGIFKAEKQAYLVDQLINDLYNRIKEDKIYVKS